jgi:L-threonylcarbamoyladenylate synthase
VETDVLAIDPAHPEPGVIARAAAVIRAGGLVAFPTETVYGLGADATDAAAVARIFAAKERALDDPVIVHIDSEVVPLGSVVREVPPLAAHLAGQCWPGPLTLVLPRGERIPPIVSAGLPATAVRVPAHPVARALIAAAGVPIAAPSANRFTRTSATTAAHVVDDLGGRIDLVLDGGPATAGIESTVVAVEGDVARILRPGALTAEALEALVREVPGARLELAPRAADARSASPGLLEKHYAPRTPLVAVFGEGPEALAAFRAVLRDEAAAGRRVGALLCTEDIALAREASPGLVAEDLGSERQPEAVARRLFAAMRALDATGVDVIVARPFPAAGLGVALRDRLRRAASRVVTVGGA